MAIDQNAAGEECFKDGNVAPLRASRQRNTGRDRSLQLQPSCRSGAIAGLEASLQAVTKEALKLTNSNCSLRYP